MCMIEKFTSRTGCAHTIDVFTRCRKAIVEEEVQCHSTQFIKAVFNDRDCAYCATSGKNEKGYFRSGYEVEQSEEFVRRTPGYERKYPPYGLHILEGAYSTKKIFTKVSSATG
ncbi:hypothetical protein TWF481_006344 [Arthrobotrys musiformis]|uniref:Uncharacterized protein n=1 Tax=Arthrobotrys musiformis TaxID=47236 RepID=A0AAV9WGL4_9PEZI